MDAFLAGTPVTLTVPLQDRSGNQLDVTSVDYRIVDQGNQELIARTALATFTASNAEAIIEVSAPINVIAAGVSREVRVVELFCNIGGNIVVLTKGYALESADPLMIGVNSFQSFAQAELYALDIPSMTAWSAAGDQEKIAALIDARQNICQLSFSLLNSNMNWGQDSLNYVPEGAYQTPYATSGSHLFMFNGNLALLAPEQFVKLPTRFKEALCRAQVAEADAIMGGNPIDIRRREGLMLESIGEVKQMFRPGKPLDLPVSKRTLKYLSRFVTFAKRIGRA